MPIIGIIAIAFFLLFPLALLFLLLDLIFTSYLPDTRWADIVRDILDEIPTVLLFVAVIGLIVSGIVAMCLYLPC